MRIIKKKLKPPIWDLSDPIVVFRKACTGCLSKKHVVKKVASRKPAAKKVARKK